MNINKETLENIHLTALDLADLMAEEFEKMKKGIDSYPNEIKGFAIDHVQMFIAKVFGRLTTESKTIEETYN